MEGKLYVVGTPIGNLGDFSPRAVETLSSVDFIAAEDTRVTLKLLNRFEIKNTLVSYHEHNKREAGEKIIEMLLGGKNGAIVTDAGMPAVSDPGEDLVRECRNRGVEVESVPGPSALITALAVSGMPSRRFSFEGFLPVDKKEKTAALEELKNDSRTLIFYEAPHKLVSTVNAMYFIFGDRNIALVRELTKIHETVKRLSLGEAVEYFKTSEPKGEYVIIVEGKIPDESSRIYTVEEAVEAAREYIESGMSPTAAAKEAAQLTGLRKRDIYSALTEK